MEYKEALEYINETKKIGSVLGLANITELLNRLENPQNKLKFVHIAGTNGKGSTSAYISSILTAAGYTVGRYISPVVFDYRESIQFSRFNEDKDKDKDKSKEVNQTDGGIDKQKTTYISEDAIARHITAIQKVTESMVNDGLDHPTPFEIETTMAFLCFLEEKCDIVVLETGLGGRLDATNVITTTICAVITEIGMDHMQFLGDTIEKIAFEKAGIIKRNVPVASYDHVKEVKEVINRVATMCNSKVVCADFTIINNPVHRLDGIVFDYCEYKNIKTKLIGENQIKNAVVAIEAIKHLKEIGYSITEDNIRLGILSARWAGRFEVINKDPIVVVDGAHNESAAISLARSIELYFSGKKLIFIMGVLADKDYESIIKHTVYLAHTVITITPDNERALSSHELALTVKRYHSNVIDKSNIKDALSTAVKLAEDEDVIISFGSLSYLGHIYNWFGSHQPLL